MILDTLQLLTLKALPGIGNKFLLKAGNYINDNQKKVSTIGDLHDVVESLKGNRYSLQDLEEAECAAKRILAANASAGIGAISYYEEIFPQSLRDTVGEDGKPSPPMVLFFKGDLRCLDMPGLAVIGTREASANGITAGRYLASEFSKRGFCIISGLAIGCDTSGHRGALDANGKTIAFLAHGLDTVYPEENKELAQEIIDKGGLLMSEYPIGEPVSRYSLVERDRLQSGLAKATLVIQTGINGGTMHAAFATLAGNKPLFTVEFNDPETRAGKNTLGNEFLHKKGAEYISGSDNLDIVAYKIKITEPIKGTLF